MMHLQVLPQLYHNNIDNIKEIRYFKKLPQNLADTLHGNKFLIVAVVVTLMVPMDNGTMALQLTIYLPCSDGKQNTAVYI